MFLEPMDSYCERLGTGLWQEPLNALASVALLGAALWLARRLRGNPPYQRLALALAAVGGSAVLAHVHATSGTAAVALAAIAGFALMAIYRITADLIGLRPMLAAVVTAIFLPFTLATMPLLTMAAGPVDNFALAPFPILLVGMAAVLRAQCPALAREFLLAAVGLTAAAVLRGLDGPLCSRWPHGTHFLYILLAGAVLLRLVAISARHALAGGDTEG